MTGDAQAAELGSFLKALRMEIGPADVCVPDTLDEENIARAETTTGTTAHHRR